MQNINKTPEIQFELLKNIKNKINELIEGKREIMYSDIINFIIRHNYRGEEYNKLILWCNQKIRHGEIFVEM